MVLEELGTWLQEKLIVEVMFVVALLVVSVVSLVCLSSRLPVSSVWMSPSMTIVGSNKFGAAKNFASLLILI